MECNFEWDELPHSAAAASVVESAVSVAVAVDIVVIDVIGVVFELYVVGSFIFLIFVGFVIAISCCCCCCFILLLLQLLLLLML